MGQSEDKLVVQHHVCVDAHESFSTDNQQVQHPNTYLRIVELHFSVVLCDDWKKYKLRHHKDAVEPAGNSQSFLAHAVVLHSSEEP